ncbi:hypothetical protein D0A37_25900 [Microcoleus vaginatus HSN003]|nr:hypothetical protein D0A37_25900 [Microcoleus vaginatus HSN003]
MSREEGRRKKEEGRRKRKEEKRENEEARRKKGRRQQPVLSHFGMRQGGVSSLHHKFDRHECPMKQTRDRTNSLFDSKTPPETLCDGIICPGRLPTRKQTLKLAGAEKPGFSTRGEKFQLCSVEDSMNRSIFGILESSTQLS